MLLTIPIPYSKHRHTLYIYQIQSFIHSLFGYTFITNNKCQNALVMAMEIFNAIQHVSFSLSIADVCVFFDRTFLYAYKKNNKANFK